MQKMPIKNFYGQIIGYIETDEKTGNKTVRNFYNQILGYYDAKRNITLDFYNRIVAQGDAAAALIDLNTDNK